MYLLEDTPDIPVIWLDTHVIGKIAFAQLEPKKSEENRSLCALYDRLVAARKAGKVLVFESDQLYEIEARPNILPELMKRCSSILTHLSQGVSTHYQYPEKMQLQIAMKAAIDNNPNATIPWRTAFLEDPFKKHDEGGFFIRATLTPTVKQLAERKHMAQEIAGQWDQIRQDIVANGDIEKERYRKQFKKELLGTQSAFRDTFNASSERRMRQQSPTTDEFWQELGIVGEPLSLWQRFGGEKGVDGVYAFLGSKYYTEQPYVRISAQLITQEIVTGQKPRAGDIMDIHHIAAFLPYCTHMVLDRSMIHAVQGLDIDDEYDTIVLRLNQLDKALDKLGV